MNKVGKQQRTYATRIKKGAWLRRNYARGSNACESEERNGKKKAKPKSELKTKRKKEEEK